MLLADSSVSAWLSAATANGESDEGLPSSPGARHAALSFHSSLGLRSMCCRRLHCFGGRPGWSVTCEVLLAVAQGARAANQAGCLAPG